MPSAEIITIGTELLLGQLVDTNTSSIARALASSGVDVHREMSVGDNEQRIASAVREALGRSDIAICAGGLGPTVDDLTREAVAAAFDRHLVLHEPSLAYIEQRFAQAGWKMAPNNRRQASRIAFATCFSTLSSNACTSAVATPSTRSPWRAPV